MASDSKNKKSKSLGARFRDGFVLLLWGDTVSSTFFGRNKFTVLVITAMLMVYISFKYECKTQKETIDRLNKELAIMRSESIRQRSEYKSGTRESTMQAVIDSLRLALHVQEQPPYLLTYEADGPAK